MQPQRAIVDRRGKTPKQFESWRIGADRLLDLWVLSHQEPQRCIFPPLGAHTPASRTLRINSAGTWSGFISYRERTRSPARLSPRIRKSAGSPISAKRSNVPATCTGRATPQRRASASSTRQTNSFTSGYREQAKRRQRGDSCAHPTCSATAVAIGIADEERGAWRDGDRMFLD